MTTTLAMVTGQTPDIEDMEVVTRETDQFVNWLNQHEATSIPCAIRMSATNIEQNDIAEACEI